MTFSGIDSIEYRKRASDLGKCADQEPDLEKSIRLLREALSWIRLAKNEEYLTVRRVRQ